MAITIEKTACLGLCPVYRVTVDNAGRGLFEGERHVAAIGPRRFSISSAQFSKLSFALAPLRPARGAKRYDPATRCGGAGRPPTDGSYTKVRWRGRAGHSQSLVFYDWCPQKDVQETVDRARRLLPIGTFIARR